MLNWFKTHRGNKTSYDTNEEWMEALRPPVDEHAVTLLRQQLIRGLKPALYKYVDRELDQFVEDVAQNALLKVLHNINSFRGESKLTTWALKIAIREGLSELRLKRYGNISIEDLKPRGNDREMAPLQRADRQPPPDQSVYVAQLMEKMMTIIEKELTQKQKRAIQAVVINGLPPAVVAKQMGTNRNALYKLIYDARLKIKTRFEKDGIDPDEMLNAL